MNEEINEAVVEVEVEFEAEDVVVKNQEDTKVEVEEVVEPEVVKPKPTPSAPKVVKEEKPVAPAPAPVVTSSLGEVVVSASALVFREHRRNSMSVAALQDRLVELGYDQARLDARGWYNVNTTSAVLEWQADSGVEATGACDGETVAGLFSGTSAEVVA